MNAGYQSKSIHESILFHEMTLKLSQCIENFTVYPSLKSFTKAYSLRADNGHLGPILTQDIDHFKG